ncbi:hypothetical protein [Streptacidiphilus albus]|uniref:hypothetical protein n=1 Tax=Streptacidiphilus albus TaxID=105425 RepID=UPI00054B0BD9|nr:hypothetical protein [Streptacidiphilus albus]
MPGQQKRKRQEQQRRQRAAARFAPGTGEWEVLFETQDEREWRTYIRRLREPGQQIDLESLRLDALCRRPPQPSTFRLSRFVPNAGERAE